jgi:hypothetical protein
MKTKQFTSLIERAIVECYGVERGSEFEDVPYCEDGGKPSLCLGICINDVVHMASVSAQAMLYLSEDLTKIARFQGGTDGDRDAGIDVILQDMEDLVLIMQLFRVAPYMQWTCIYFPGIRLGDDQIDTGDGT